MSAGELTDHGMSAETAAPLRVLVVDDDPLLRQAVRVILRHAGISIVGEADNGRDAVRMTRHYKPDVVLMDVVMPSMDGLSALEHIAEEHGVSPRVVMLSVHGDHDIAFLALRKGALGYMNKDSDLGSLPRVLREVAGGSAHLSRSLTTHLVQRLRELPEGGVRMRPIQSVLTAREWEVADMLATGHKTDEIATAMVLTTETVRTHIKNMMRKLDVHRRAELIDAVERLRSGLVPEHDPARALFSRSAA